MNGDRVEARERRDVDVITDDGVVLSVRDTGRPDAEHTVVFLHGLCLSRMCWARQDDNLAKDYGPAVRTISYDHRGHGRSGHAPMSTYRIERLAEDLAQVLEAMRVGGSVTLVGHSMGGMAALGYLGRDVGRRPIDPAGLVLVATAAGKLRHRGLGRLLGTPATGALFGMVDHTPEQMVRAILGPLCSTLRRWHHGASAATLATVAADALAAASVATAVGFLPALRDYDQYDMLATIRARTVVLSGGVDPLTPAVHGRDLVAGIPGAELVHLPTAGHMLPQESPHVVYEAIRRAIGIDSRGDLEAGARPAGLGARPAVAGVAS
ncbi:alpha/beta fold hydrolase [Mycolicibacterium nivoides]|uniref:Alpha/beta fold hydrolase n=1 Tax=Mycolicibacterium nivoides TaxID=2487344 RepID=A0ABW9LJE0_9MYCO